MPGYLLDTQQDPHAWMQENSAAKLNYPAVEDAFEKRHEQISHNEWWNGVSKLEEAVVCKQNKQTK